MQFLKLTAFLKEMGPRPCLLAVDKITSFLPITDPEENVVNTLVVFGELGKLASCVSVVESVEEIISLLLDLGITLDPGKLN